MKKTILQIAGLAVVAGLVFFLVRFRDGRRAAVPEAELITVEVTGNVEKPGLYRVPRGTSKFSILEQAGVRPNSDLRLVQVAETVEQNQKISVGVGKVAGLRDQPLGGWARVNFFLGTVSLVDSAGKKSAVAINKNVPLKSIVQTETDGHCEVLLSDASALTLWPNARCAVNKIMAMNAEGMRETEISLLSGLVEGVVRPQGANRFLILTPQARVVVKGTELSVKTGPDQSTIKVTNGFVEVQRIKDGATINLVGGQFAVVSADTAAALEVQYLTAESAQEKDQREIFRKEKQNYQEKNASFKILYVGNPNVFLVFNIDPAAKAIIISRLPGDLNISNIVEGFEKLNQAFLFGGAQFTMSVCERLVKSKIDFYLVHSVADVKMALAKLGNLPVDVDVAAAKYLTVGAGVQNLTPEQAARFMAPGISGMKDAEMRQNKVLESIFKEMKSKKLRLSPLFAESILQGTKSDLNAKKIMDIYKTFTLSEDWTFKVSSEI